MLVSYKWLKELVDIEGISPQELSDKMSTTGIEVEGFESPSDGLKKIVVGHVLVCVPHPDSDHLHICQVDVGDEEPYQIVCGAPNVVKGQKVIVALPGARIAGNYKIKKGKIRGEVSLGMLCSLQELGINESVVPKEVADGIYILPEDAPIGEDVFPILEMDDTVIELSITPNRADALSMRGVAHEVAAIYNKKVNFEEVHLEEDATDSIEKYISVDVEDTEDVPTYNMRVVKDIQVAPSPMWLQNRLMNEGIRPINNIVDVTNYILLYYGQPLHAFDFEKLNSNKIVIRRAKDGENFVTLDGEERTLSSDNIVITNGEIPVALAGVMGGANTEIDSSSTTVAFEAALFNGSSIRKTSKQFNLRSESSARFEKGINQATVLQAMDEAAQMMAELGGGTVVSGYATNGEFYVQDSTVAISLEEINRSLGTTLEDEEVRNIFDALGFGVTDENNKYVVSIPPRRWDISIKQDIVEEVARIYGYDKLPSTLPSGESFEQGLTPTQKTTRMIQTTLEACGLSEIISYALTTEEKSKAFAFETDSLITKLDWPMTEEREALRLNLISGLLENVAYNVARQNSNLSFYEMGRVFQQFGNPLKDLPKEETHLAIAMSGLRAEKDWQTRAEKVDFFTIKGALEVLFDTLSVTNEIAYEAWCDNEKLHPGRSAKIFYQGNYIGFVGQLHPSASKQWDIPETYIAEVNLEPFFESENKTVIFEAISKFPEVRRDMALLVNKEVSNQQILQTISSVGGKYLKHIHLFDLFEGKKLGVNKKSLAYTLTFSNPENTLTDEEINGAMQKIEKKLVEELQVEIR